MESDPFFFVTPDTTFPYEVKISFGFLDPKDGAVIEILHTSESYDAEILGTILGMPKGFRDHGRIHDKTEISKRISFISSPRKLPWIVLMIGVLIAISGVLIPTVELERFLQIDSSNSNPMILAGIFYAMMGFVMLFLIRRKYPKSLHIEGLDKIQA